MKKRKLQRVKESFRQAILDGTSLELERDRICDDIIRAATIAIIQLDNEYKDAKEIAYFLNSKTSTLSRLFSDAILDDLKAGRDISTSKLEKIQTEFFVYTKDRVKAAIEERIAERKEHDTEVEAQRKAIESGKLL